jgi:hypothetical protein
MSAYFASVNGNQIVSGSLLIPLVGAWTADLHLATDAALTGAVVVVIGNLTLHGSVYRSSSYGGQTRARIVAGAGGWRSVIGKQGYGSRSGVKVSHVLQDAAGACGETVNVAKDMTIGNAYTRAEGNASDALWQMVAQKYIPSWHIDAAGVTQVTPWPASPVTTPFTPVDHRPDEGIVTIATEDYAAWMPGCTFSSPLLTGSYSSGGVEYVFDNDGKFRFLVLTGDTDRVNGPIDRIVMGHLRPTRFHGRYEYTISNPTTSTVDCTPMDDSFGLPDLTGVPLNGDSISVYTPPAGGACHVMFLNGVPTKPIVVWTEGNPSHADILAGTTPAAKLGDTVQSMLVLAPPSLTGTLQFAGAPGPMVVGVPYAIVPAASSLIGLTPISGTVTTGSSQVGMPV